jgi:hypothetical protein
MLIVEQPLFYLHNLLGYTSLTFVEVAELSVTENL